MAEQNRTHIHERTPRRGRSPVARRSAFSLAEMMIAVVILGIGLLITSSMFPIAWYKARDVAEFTNVTAATDAADVSTELFFKTAPYASWQSRFFPGDWYPPISFSTAADDSDATLFPDTHVHAYNLGNYLVGYLEEEVDPFEPTETIMVSDQTWTLDDILYDSLSDPNVVQNVKANELYLAEIKPNARVVPPIDARPTPDDADDVLDNLWYEKFNNRRYCWSVLYRFSDMPGIDGNVTDSPWFGCRQIVTGCDTAATQLRDRLNGSRRLSIYYVTMKRPVGARYARQVGYTRVGASGSWPVTARLDQPRARPPAEDVLLPSPWRIQATLLTVPADREAVPTGVPSEIAVDDEVLFSMLQVDSTLIDDRTGQVFTITARRDVENQPNQAVFTLNAEYTGRDIYAADYTPFPADAGPFSLPRTALNVNWIAYWDFQHCLRDKDCSDPDSTNFDLDTYWEDEPEIRTYWIFPPPVEATRLSNGVPLFEDSQPVVGVEVRQMVIEPKE